MTGTRGTGAICQLKDGRFCVTLKPPGTKRIFRYRHTREAAEAVLAHLHIQYGVSLVEAALDRGDVPLLSEWAAHWLAAQEGRLRLSTWITYRRQISRVLPAFGTTPLDRLTPLALTSFLVELRKSGIGGRQLQQVYTVLRACLENATKLDVIPSNPMRKVDKPRHEAAQRDYWTIEQTKSFLDTALASPRRFAPVLTLLTTTGLRMSEALGLEWEDVDMELGVLRVRRALVWVYGEYRIDATKTKAGRRTINLPSQALTALQRWIAHETDEGKGLCGPIFRGPTGEPPTTTNLRRLLLDLCKAAGVPPINVHGLRHVAATMALKATRDIHAVQRRLGHSNVSFTLSVYAYALADDSEVAEAVDTLLGGKTAAAAEPKLEGGRAARRGTVKEQQAKGKKRDSST